MPFKSLDDKFHVAPQVTIEQLDAARDAGVTTVISHRPDGEEPGQLSFADLETAAAERGMKAVHIPVVPGRLTPTHVDALKQATDDCDGKILAFCKSGMRASMVWALAQKGEISPQEIMACCQKAGCDVSPLAAHLS